MKTVMIISDATGETAERMVRAATLQFSEPVQIRLYSRVRLESELESILEKASELRALVVFTVVNTEERALISQLVERYNIETVDLIGALISKLATYIGSAPAGVPGRLDAARARAASRLPGKPVDDGPPVPVGAQQDVVPAAEQGPEDRPGAHLDEVLGERVEPALAVQREVGRGRREAQHRLVREAADDGEDGADDGRPVGAEDGDAALDPVRERAGLAHGRTGWRAGTGGRAGTAAGRSARAAAAGSRAAGSRASAWARKNAP